MNNNAESYKFCEKKNRLYNKIRVNLFFYRYDYQRFDNILN